MCEGNFTVLMAVYHKDSADLLRKAINSVFANTMLPVKFVLVGDGPLSKELTDVIEDFSGNNRFLFHQMPVNLGLPSALNAGLEFVTTEYVIRADADDINLPRRFEVLIRKLSDGFDIVGSAIQEVDKMGGEVARRVPPETDSQIRVYLKKRNPFNHMSVGYRVAMVRSCGGYPSLYLREDYGLWAKMISSGARAYNFQQSLVCATAGTDMYKRRGGVRYALAEFDLQLWLYRCGIVNFVEAVLNGLSRGVVFLLPNWLRGLVYIHYLRK
jgi:glycosyltransferase involved in cell wall biosynthesis